MRTDSHISDQDLILAADGELSKRRTSDIWKHVTGCSSCRIRMREIEDTIASFVRAYHANLAPHLPSSYASRATLKAQLNQLAGEHPEHTFWRAARSLPIWRPSAYLFCSFALTLAVLMLWQSPGPTLASSPDPRLTPGATLSVTEADICARQPTTPSRLVLASVGKKVFEKYGISNPQPRRYELDYLIDPDLGGSNDTRNLWPQPYSVEWNAHVKDALEEHLRELVCMEKVTLAQAQRDISVDWISAYKKYFRTDHPISDHLAFIKDEPWE